jgi:hypothetical protein
MIAFTVCIAFHQVIKMLHDYESLYIKKRSALMLIVVRYYMVFPGVKWS